MTRWQRFRARVGQWVGTGVRHCSQWAGRIWPRFLIFCAVAFAVAAAYAFRVAGDWHYGWGGSSPAIVPTAHHAAITKQWIPWKFVQEIDLVTMAESCALVAAICFCLWCLHWYRVSERQFKETIARRQAAMQGQQAPVGPQAQGGNP